jgi:hypothetical protein
MSDPLRNDSFRLLQEFPLQDAADEFAYRHLPLMGGELNAGPKRIAYADSPHLLWLRSLESHAPILYKRIDEIKGFTGKRK